MLSPFRIAWGEIAGHLRATQLLARYASSSNSNLRQFDNEMVPLSQAVTQLEAVLLDASLPTEARAGNKKAFTALRSFVDSLSNPHSYPAASIRTVQFTVIDEAAQQRKVRTVLKTTGGDCSRLVQQTLGDLLQLCGLSPLVYFDGDQFNPKQPVRKRQRMAAPRASPLTPAEVAAVRARAAAAGFPSQAITQEQFDELEAEHGAKKEAKAAADEAAERLKGDLQRLDPLLKACAAMPWLPRDGDGQLRAQKIKSEVVDHLETWGWDIRGALARLWGGERSASELCVGKEGGTKAAIQALLFHAKQLDKDYGKMVET